MLRARQDLKVTAADALEFEAVAPEVRRPRRGMKLVLWVAALGAVAAGGWLTYGDRVMAYLGDSGVDVPTIRAVAGPVKVRPENPGGLQVPNRDKLVYGRLQGSGTRESALSQAQTVERLLPGPEAPLPKPIAPATPASAAVGASSAIPEAPPGSAASLPSDPVPALADVQSVRPPPPPPVPQSVGSRARNAPLRLTKRAQPLNLNKNASSAATPAPAPAPAPVPRASVVAAPPSAPTQTAAAQPAPPPPVPAPPVPDAAPAQPSTASTPPVQVAQAAAAANAFRVQLAASRSPERARAAWDSLRRKHLDLLGDLGLTVTKADLGPKKGIFYRLRVGPIASEGEARALCKELANRKMGCLVVKPGR